MELNYQSFPIENDKEIPNLCNRQASSVYSMIMKHSTQTLFLGMANGCINYVSMRDTKTVSKRLRSSPNPQKIWPSTTKAWPIWSCPGTSRTCFRRPRTAACGFSTRARFGRFALSARVREESFFSRRSAKLISCWRSMSRAMFGFGITRGKWSNQRGKLTHYIKCLHWAIIRIRFIWSSVNVVSIITMWETWRSSGSWDAKKRRFWVRCFWGPLWVYPKIGRVPTLRLV